MSDSSTKSASPYSEVLRIHECAANHRILLLFQNNTKQKCCPILDISVSGSPIIQDGKLVGAVTHVLVNDPTTGYGIFIENMLDAAA